MSNDYMIQRMAAVEAMLADLDYSDKLHVLEKLAMKIRKKNQLRIEGIRKEAERRFHNRKVELHQI